MPKSWRIRSCECRYFGKYKGLWSVAFSTFILLAGFMPFLWSKSAALVAWAGLDAKNEIYVAITYELLESLQVLPSSMPLSLVLAGLLRKRTQGSLLAQWPAGQASAPPCPTCCAICRSALQVLMSIHMVKMVSDSPQGCWCSMSMQLE